MDADRDENTDFDADTIADIDGDAESTTDDHPDANTSGSDADSDSDPLGYTLPVLAESWGVASAARALGDLRGRGWSRRRTVAADRSGDGEASIRTVGQRRERRGCRVQKIGARSGKRITAADLGQCRAVSAASS